MVWVSLSHRLGTLKWSLEVFKIFGLAMACVLCIGPSLWTYRPTVIPVESEFIGCGDQPGQYTYIVEMNCLWFTQNP